MNRIVLVISLVFSMSLLFMEKIQAQRCLPGMRGIELRAGTVDGFKQEKNKEAFYLGAAISKYASGGNKWVFGAEYLQKNYDYKEMAIPVSAFTAEGGYYYNFLSDGSKTLFMSLGISALGGYETCNWEDKVLYDGSTLTNEGAFVYGGAATLEIENYLSDRIVLVISARQRMLFGSSVSKFHTQVGVGLKFIIN
ncbi:conjugal transfer protein TraO [Dysgonomonas sp. GY75]|uniref:conjugal transfer protein TraO n=1 Tax=Dysgonomonas sp. GY75 TaxID=2780419 RepID=UPI00188357D5|nr:conjugal transfer protein TraO [Dysgonomonas sp. GY75]MBF0647244.1 conjugal transfer protein TraO [Dysgonomonas sp. GY75]